MSGAQTNNPLHGLTLESIVVKLVDQFGWEGLAKKISIKCFQNDPSVKSSLTFLRKTPWARAEVEKLYVATFVNSVWAKAAAGAARGGDAEQ